MKSRSVLVASQSALALTICCTCAHAQAPQDRKPLPFPSGYDFPADPSKLEQMIRARDTAGLRRHGWYLWAGVNQPGYDNWPIWRSWYIATQAFAPPSTARSAQDVGAPAAVPRRQARSLAVRNQSNNPTVNLNLPVYLIPDAVRIRNENALSEITNAANIPDGDNFQNNGDLMLVSEPYSQPGFEWIRNANLYLSSTLNALMRGAKSDIPQFPPTTIVMKHMYWPVKRDGLSALPLVDVANYYTQANPVTTYVGFENQQRWPRAVAIDPTRDVIPPGEKADVTFLYDVMQLTPGQNPLVPWGPNTYKGATVVPISSFYHRKLSQKDFDALSANDRALIDASFYWAHGRVFQDGDYLAAIASHVITKEIPQWTLQTFWWSDQPDADNEFSRDRPDIPPLAQGPWRHYLMASEYGITVAPNELPIRYNPYIELASHPVQTNCRNCHVRASWPTGAYIQNPGPSAVADVQPNDPIFADSLRSDFLWTVPDRAIKPGP